MNTRTDDGRAALQWPRTKAEAVERIAAFPPSLQCHARPSAHTHTLPPAPLGMDSSEAAVAALEFLRLPFEMAEDAPADVIVGAARGFLAALSVALAEGSFPAEMSGRGQGEQHTCTDEPDESLLNKVSSSSGINNSSPNFYKKENEAYAPDLTLSSCEHALPMLEGTLSPTVAEASAPFVGFGATSRRASAPFGGETCDPTAPSSPMKTAAPPARNPLSSSRGGGGRRRVTIVEPSSPPSPSPTGTGDVKLSQSNDAEATADEPPSSAGHHTRRSNEENKKATAAPPSSSPSSGELTHHRQHLPAAYRRRAQRLEEVVPTESRTLPSRVPNAAFEHPPIKVMGAPIESFLGSYGSRERGSSSSPHRRRSTVNPPISHSLHRSSSPSPHSSRSASPTRTLGGATRGEEDSSAAEGNEGEGRSVWFGLVDEQPMSHDELVARQMAFGEAEALRSKERREAKRLKKAEVKAKRRGIEGDERSIGDAATIPSSGGEDSDFHLNGEGNKHPPPPAHPSLPLSSPQTPHYFFQKAGLHSSREMIEDARNRRALQFLLDVERQTRKRRQREGRQLALSTALAEKAAADRAAEERERNVFLVTALVTLPLTFERLFRPQMDRLFFQRQLSLLCGPLFLRFLRRKRRAIMIKRIAHAASVLPNSRHDLPCWAGSQLYNYVDNADETVTVRVAADDPRSGIGGVGAGSGGSAADAAANVLFGAGRRSGGRPVAAVPLLAKEAARPSPALILAPPTAPRNSTAHSNTNVNSGSPHTQTSLSIAAGARTVSTSFVNGGGSEGGGGGLSSASFAFWGPKVGGNNNSSGGGGGRPFLGTLPSASVAYRPASPGGSDADEHTNTTLETIGSSREEDNMMEKDAEDAEVTALFFPPRGRGLTATASPPNTFPTPSSDATRQQRGRKRSTATSNTARCTATSSNVFPTVAVPLEAPSHLLLRRWPHEALTALIGQMTPHYYFAGETLFFADDVRNEGSSDDATSDDEELAYAMEECAGAVSRLRDGGSVDYSSSPFSGGASPFSLALGSAGLGLRGGGGGRRRSSVGSRSSAGIGIAGAHRYRHVSSSGYGGGKRSPSQQQLASDPLTPPLGAAGLCRRSPSSQSARSSSAGGGGQASANTVATTTMPQLSAAHRAKAKSRRRRDAVLSGRGGALSASAARTITIKHKPIVPPTPAEVKSIQQQQQQQQQRGGGGGGASPTSSFGPIGSAASATTTTTGSADASAAAFGFTFGSPSPPSGGNMIYSNAHQISSSSDSDNDDAATVATTARSSLARQQRLRRRSQSQAMAASAAVSRSPSGKSNTASGEPQQTTKRRQRAASSVSPSASTVSPQQQQQQMARATTTLRQNNNNSNKKKEPHAHTAWSLGSCNLDYVVLIAAGDVVEFDPSLLRAHANRRRALEDRRRWRMRQLSVLESQQQQSEREVGGGESAQQQQIRGGGGWAMARSGGGRLSVASAATTEAGEESESEGHHRRRTLKAIGGSSSPSEGGMQHNQQQQQQRHSTRRDNSFAFAPPFNATAEHGTADTAMPTLPPIPVAYYPRGAFVGLLQATMGVPFSRTIRCETDVIAYRIPIKKFLKFITVMPIAAPPSAAPPRYSSHNGHQQQQQQQQVSNSQTQPPTAVLASFLAPTPAPTTAADVGKVERLPSPPPQQGQMALSSTAPQPHITSHTYVSKADRHAHQLFVSSLQAHKHDLLTACRAACRALFAAKDASREERDRGRELWHRQQLVLRSAAGSPLSFFGGGGGGGVFSSNQYPFLPRSSSGAYIGSANSQGHSSAVPQLTSIATPTTLAAAVPTATAAPPPTIMRPIANNGDYNAVLSIHSSNNNNNDCEERLAEWAKRLEHAYYTAKPTAYAADYARGGGSATVGGNSIIARTFKASHPLFSDLPDAVLNSLRADVIRVVARPGEVICPDLFDASAGGRLFVVRRGSASLVTTRESPPLITAPLNALIAAAASSQQQAHHTTVGIAPVFATAAREASRLSVTANDTTNHQRSGPKDPIIVGTIGRQSRDATAEKEEKEAKEQSEREKEDQQNGATSPKTAAKPRLSFAVDALLASPTAPRPPSTSANKKRSSAASPPTSPRTRLGTRTFSAVALSNGIAAMGGESQPPPTTQSPVVTKLSEEPVRVGALIGIDALFVWDSANMRPAPHLSPQAAVMLQAARQQNTANMASSAAEQRPAYTAQTLSSSLSHQQQQQQADGSASDSMSASASVTTSPLARLVAGGGNPIWAKISKIESEQLQFAALGGGAFSSSFQLSSAPSLPANITAVTSQGVGSALPAQIAAHCAVSRQSLVANTFVEYYALPKAALLRTLRAHSLLGRVRRTVAQHALLTAPNCIRLLQGVPSAAPAASAVGQASSPKQQPSPNNLRPTPPPPGGKSGGKVGVSTPTPAPTPTPTAVAPSSTSTPHKTVGTRKDFEGSGVAAMKAGEAVFSFLGNRALLAIASALKVRVLLPGEKIMGTARLVKSVSGGGGVGASDASEGGKGAEGTEGDDDGGEGSGRAAAQPTGLGTVFADPAGPPLGAALAYATLDGGSTAAIVKPIVHTYIVGASAKFAVILLHGTLEQTFKAGSPLLSKSTVAGEGDPQHATSSPSKAGGKRCLLRYPWSFFGFSETLTERPVCYDLSAVGPAIVATISRDQLLEAVLSSAALTNPRLIGKALRIREMGGGAGVGDGTADGGLLTAGGGVGQSDDADDFDAISSGEGAMSGAALRREAMAAQRSAAILSALSAADDPIVFQLLERADLITAAQQRALGRLWAPSTCADSFSAPSSPTSSPTSSSSVPRPPSSNSPTSAAEKATAKGGVTSRYVQHAKAAKSQQGKESKEEKDSHNNVIPKGKSPARPDASSLLARGDTISGVNSGLLKNVPTPASVAADVSAAAATLAMATIAGHAEYSRNTALRAPTLTTHTGAPASPSAGGSKPNTTKTDTTGNAGGKGSNLLAAASTAAAPFAFDEEERHREGRQKAAARATQIHSDEAKQKAAAADAEAKRRAEMLALRHGKTRQDRLREAAEEEAWLAAKAANELLPALATPTATAHPSPTRSAQTAKTNRRSSTASAAHSNKPTDAHNNVNNGNENEWGIGVDDIDRDASPSRLRLIAYIEERVRVERDFAAAQADIERRRAAEAEEAGAGLAALAAGVVFDPLTLTPVVGLIEGAEGTGGAIAAERREESLRAAKTVMRPITISEVFPRTITAPPPHSDVVVAEGQTTEEGVYPDGEQQYLSMLQSIVDANRDADFHSRRSAQSQSEQLGFASRGGRDRAFLLATNAKAMAPRPPPFIAPEAIRVTSSLVFSLPQITPAAPFATGSGRGGVQSPFAASANAAAPFSRAAANQRSVRVAAAMASIVEGDGYRQRAARAHYAFVGAPTPITPSSPSPSPARSVASANDRFTATAPARYGEELGGGGGRAAAFSAAALSGGVSPRQRIGGRLPSMGDGIPSAPRGGGAQREGGGGDEWAMRMRSLQRRAKGAPHTSFGRMA